MSRRWLDLALNRAHGCSATLSRRQLLHVALVSASGLLSGRSLNAVNLRRERPRVVVVGAGFAGLACAFELISVGYHVNVVEARNRLGGRVKTLRELIPGKSVEAGGEFLGSNHVHALAYATKFGFELAELSEALPGPSPIILSGRKLTAAEIERISAEIDMALKVMTDDARAVVLEEPWKTPDAVRLDRKTTAEWIDATKISPLAKALLTVQFTGTNGVATDRQSYLGNLTQVCGGGLEKYWTDTEVYRLKGGNQQYAERLAKEIGQEHVFLNCAVRQIITDERRAIVVDSEGKRHEADDVVLAVPPSVWPAIQFTPALPESLKPQMGMNVKFLAVIQRRFFLESKLPPRATTDQDISQVWDGTDTQAGEGPAAMIAFSGGPPAERVHRKAAVDREAAYLDALEVLFPGFKDQFVKGQFIDWIADQWTGGGYSFPAPGQVTTIGPQLRAGRGRLHFAGEHTCYPFVGYMEGALNSGASLAKRIAARDAVIR